EVAQVEIADRNIGKESGGRRVLTGAVHVTGQERQGAFHADGIAADGSGGQRPAGSFIRTVRGRSVHPRQERLGVGERGARERGAFLGGRLERTRERFQGTEAFKKRLGHGGRI